MILLSNRDEFFERPTAKAHFWGTNDEILSPVDLQRPEHGTWIGMSRKGRICVLLNCHEDRSNDAVGQVSRGLFTRDFLVSEQPAGRWIEGVRQRIGDDRLAQAGGFWMLCGDVRDFRSHANRLRVFTNRSHEFHHETCGTDTICVSNGFDSTWEKLARGSELLDAAVSENEGSTNDDETALVDRLFGVLSDNTYPDAWLPSIYDLRKSIFIPRLQFPTGTYGTRTQTVVLIDNQGRARYIERNLDSNVNSDFTFTIDNWDAAQRDVEVDNKTGAAAASISEESRSASSSDTTAVLS